MPPNTSSLNLIKWSSFVTHLSYSSGDVSSTHHFHAGLWLELVGPEGVEGVVFIIPEFMVFLMKHKIPEQHGELQWTSQSVQKGQPEPQRTTNKQLPNNEGVHSGAGLNVSDSLVLYSGLFDHPPWPPTHPLYCRQSCLPEAAGRVDQSTTINTWIWLLGQYTVGKLRVWSF